MSQTETPGAPPSGFLNTPPMMMPPGFPGGENGGQPMTTDQVASMLAKASSSDPPQMEDGAVDTTVVLPGGWVTPEGLLVTTARVRELNGYDEEKLARIDMQKNVAVYVTELLLLGVEELGGSKPSRDVLRQLLIGDRDALVLGIRQATYGNEVQFKLSCAACGNDSEVDVLIDEDVSVTKLEDPLVRTFEVPLRHGLAKVALLNGVAQEAFSEKIGKRTQAEINTVMLAKSVTEINGVPVFGKDADVKALSAADRETLMTFIADHQPGPQFKEIPVPCATCGEEYPVSLGLPNLFRF